MKILTQADHLRLSPGILTHASIDFQEGNPSIDLTQSIQALAKANKGLLLSIEEDFTLASHPAKAAPNPTGQPNDPQPRTLSKSVKYLDLWEEDEE